MQRLTRDMKPHCLLGGNSSMRSRRFVGTQHFFAQSTGPYGRASQNASALHHEGSHRLLRRRALPSFAPIAKDGDKAAEKEHSETALKVSDDTTETTTTIPGAQTGGRKMAIVFTCNVCETRSAKQFTEQAYQRGVVIVRCPGCESLHLIADRLGYFADGEWDLNKLAETTGQDIKHITEDGVMELSLEELVGKERAFVDGVAIESPRKFS